MHLVLPFEPWVPGVGAFGNSQGRTLAAFCAGSLGALLADLKLYFEIESEKKAEHEKK